MSVRQEVQQINRLDDLIEHGPIPPRRRDREPTRPPGNPNPNFAVIMLAICKMAHIIDNNPLRKVILVKN
jgi:hypothetical protein